jgi:hypothetical protein
MWLTSAAGELTNTFQGAAYDASLLQRRFRKLKPSSLALERLMASFACALHLHGRAYERATNLWPGSGGQR